MPEQTDGLLWGYQLWVNLPARLKMAPARYQDIPAEKIPEVVGDGSTVRVIAGTFQGVAGAAETLTPVTYLDAHLDAGRTITLPLADGFNVLVYIYEGAMDGADSAGREQPVEAGKMAIMSRRGDVEVTAGSQGARCLVIAGAAHDEPIARMGPFVMNTRAELTQAMEDYRGGTLTG
jgi:redox-sensitive bicupin YhaK (pirin superfamily)